MAARLQPMSGLLPPCTCLHAGRRSLSTSSTLLSGTKKVRKVQLQPKRREPLRMTPKKTGIGEVRSRYGQGRPLSQKRDPSIFLPTMQVDQLPVFAPSAFARGSSKGKPGTVMRYPPAVDELYKVYGAHRRMEKERGYTASMTTVPTRDTAAIISRLQQASQHGSKEALRLCLTGPTYSGKSALLDQAVAYARLSEWAVLYLPTPRRLLNGWEPFAYSEANGYYLQDGWSHAFLRSIHAANKAVLPSALLKQLDKTIKASEGHSAALESFIDALIAQKDVPVLVAIDNAQMLFRPTAYPDVATMKPLDSFAFSGPRLLLDLATGARPITNGGVILAQSFEQRDMQSDTLDTVLGLRERDPYEELKEGNLAYAVLAEKIERFDVGRLDRQEAVGIFELLRDTARLHAAPSDRMFLQHYIATDGLAGEFKRSLTESISTA